MERKYEALCTLSLLAYFVTMSHCVTQASLELTTLPLGLMSAGIIDLGQQTQLPSVTSQVFMKQ